MSSVPTRRAGKELPDVREIVRGLTTVQRADEVVTAVRHVPAREAAWAPIPEWLSSDIARAYGEKGVTALYSHQSHATERIRSGRNVVIVTPTSSGKTLCYNLPVLHAIAENPEVRAMYIFPTKALAQDQLEELHDLGRRLGDTFGVFTYDGDTPSDARRSIRQQGHIVLTNPDMLHTGILPHHTRWTRLFENLRYIVIDELHMYRGVFGSHLANVLRRLKRVARFYGRSPQFICCSATIANPGDLARRLIEEDVDVIDENGAPAAEKYFIFYNPPVVDRFLGIRRSYINETARLAQEFIRRGFQTIVFANSRLHTEVLLTYLRQANPQPPGAPEVISGYRGGYLPLERREVERNLRSGQVRGVVATNALELGIDVGSLDASVMAGYPGTIASMLQRAGRAGRRKGTSCALLVASSRPLDQFIVKNPEYFFAGSPEHAYIQADNPEILVNHLKCAAFELPLGDEPFGTANVGELCEKLAEAGYLHRSGEFYYWTQEAYPADTVSLRTVTSDNFVIIDETEGPEVIGEVDFSSALTTVHPKAIYIHGGRQYHVERLEFEERKAYVRQVDVDYFTQAIRYTEVKKLNIADSGPVSGPAIRAHGDVLVRSQVVGFKKIKFFTLENVGSGKLELPENEMHTTAYWVTLKRDLLASLPFSVPDRQDGMYGLLYALESIASLILMCDRMDLGATIGEGSQEDGGTSAPDQNRPEPGPTPGAQELFEPTLYLYDAYPGGIGLSEPLFHIHALLVARTRELILGCACEKGCPSCVGPAGETGRHAKEAALAILERLIAETADDHR